MSRPCYINELQWNRECFFLRHVELNSKFIVMTRDIVSTKNRHGLQRHLLCLPVETLPNQLEFFNWDLHSFKDCSRLEKGTRNSKSLPDIFCCTILLLWIWIHHLLDWSILPMLWFFEEKIWCIQLFQNLPDLLSEFLHSKFSHDQLRAKGFLVILSCQTDEFVIHLSLKSDDIQTLLQRHYLPIEWFSISSFFRSFPVCQKVLAIFAESKSIPSSNPDCSNTADEPSICRTALSPMPLVQNRWGVEMRWFHGRSSHVFQTFGLCDRSEDVWQTSSLHMWCLCFARIQLNPLSSKILYHDSVPVIVSWFTFLVDNLVISRYQVT